MPKVNKKYYYNPYHTYKPSFALWVLKLISTFLIGTGLCILTITYYPVFYQEAKYYIRNYNEINNPKNTEIKILPSTAIPTIFYGDQTIEPVSGEFSLVIPKLEINSVVFKNVSANNDYEYLPVLQKGLAQAKEAFLPGEGLVFIFGHSTDAFYNIPKYNAQFFLLHQMVQDDDVFLIYENKALKYKVRNTKVVYPNQVNAYLNTLKGNELVLQTCYPPGTLFKRLLVVAEPITSVNNQLKALK